MLKITNAKTGATMIELMVISILVGVASFGVLSINLSRMDYKDGVYDANKADALLQDTLMQHPINSMIRPQLYTLSPEDNEARNEIILRQGFSDIPQEALDESKNRYFKHGVNSEKHPITVAASLQYYSLNMMIKSKEVCAGFASQTNGIGSWTSLSINGSKLKLSIASGGEISSLCRDDELEYDVTLEYCLPTAILTCA
ncbi:hypothetical protein OTK49_01850 [Vibrio coralliirubri]|uniref:hypothetical protein n=1 Tax=Vibrio coralliirubri TaxID=1516159 RepID=UPI002283F1F8|nr:hypothetical protein [Vibrio coralliirubri]MCY9861257.1 hypothetical protein [Vibrio coralliirubri]